MVLFRCLKCGKAILYPSLLRKHRCRGVGFRCPICFNIYPDVKALRQHARMSHGDLWSRCPICCKEYKRANIHYRRKRDEKHKILYLLTAAANGRCRGRPPIRRIAEAYGGLLRVVG
jgi:hypothetical protein